MGILELQIRASGNFNQLIHRPQQVGAPEKPRICHRNLGLCPGVHGEGLIVLHAERSNLLQLLHVGIEPGLIHHPERNSGGTLLQGLFQNGEHLLLLFRCQLPVLNSADGGTG